MISTLQFISNDFSRSHIQNIELACKAGLKWIQLRAKNIDLESYIELAENAQNICVKYNAQLIINDNWHVAESIIADGVHVGLNDTPVNQVRNKLGDSYIIGGTANTLDDVVHHVSNGADYVGLGPYKFTNTKNNLSPILGLVGYEKIINNLQKQNIKIPIIAIGGINLEDIQSLKDVGVHGIAFSTLITESENSFTVVEKLQKIFQ
ncbi:MAG: thiamine phosphate synthase [Cytophagales bacterium]